MSGWVFWFLVAVVLYIVVLKSSERNKELKIELNMLKDKYRGLNRAYGKLNEKNEALSTTISKSKMAIRKMQAGLSKMRGINNKQRTELALVVKERDRLQERIDRLHRSIRPGIHSS